MNKAVYILGKIFMGVMLLVMLATATSNKLIWTKSYLVFIPLGFTVILYIGSRITGVKRGRSRITYEFLPYVGGVATIVLAIKYSTPAAEIRKMLEGAVYMEEKVKNHRLFLVLFIGSIILFLVAKTYCLIYETEDYNNSVGERARRAEKAIEEDLDKEVEAAQAMIDRSKDPIEIANWEEKLRKAKNKREKYYRDKNK